MFLELQIICQVFMAVLNLQHTNTSWDSGHIRKNGRILEHVKANEEADPDAMIEGMDPDATAETINLTTFAAVTDPDSTAETINLSTLAAVGDATDTTIQEAAAEAPIEDDRSPIDPPVAPADTINLSTLDPAETPIDHMVPQAHLSQTEC